MALENYVKFLRGTPAAYEKLAHKDRDTLYFISENDSDNGSLYLGSKLIAGSDQPEKVILDALKDVLNNNSLLVYDEDKELWINKNAEEIFKSVVREMIGATDTLDGKSGLVPAPAAGEQDYFLRGDGTWAKISASTTTAAESQVFQTIIENNQDHIEAIAKVVGSKILHQGDIAIVKEKIAGDKYHHTAYVYKNGWVAMDGNYNAETVYFDEDLLTTSPIGVIELVNGQATIPTSGKNLKEVFNTILIKEQNPITTSPSITIDLSASGKFEVGTVVPINYTIGFNSGSYSFGPNPTGVNITTCTITDGTNIKNSLSGSFDNLLITDDINYHLTATIGYGDGEIPITNLGNSYSNGQILAKTIVGNSSYIKSFRPFFYGMDNSKAPIYNSDFIRSLINGGEYDNKKVLTFDASKKENVKRFIVAIPEDSIIGDRKGIVSANITTSMGANALSFYKEINSTVLVNGANGHEVSVPYKVWIYEPASIAPEEVHEVVLN